MGEHKSAFWLAILNVFSVIFFIILVISMNVLGMAISNPLLARAIMFINENFLLLLASGIFVGIGDVCIALFFPLSLPGPLIRAIGSALFTMVIMRVFWLMDEILKISAFEFLHNWEIPICVAVFVLATVFGYFKLLLGFATGHK